VKDESESMIRVLNEVETQQLEFSDPHLFRDLLGQHDQHVKILQHALQVRIRVLWKKDIPSTRATSTTPSAS